MQSRRFNPEEVNVPKDIHEILRAAALLLANDERQKAIKKVTEIAALNNKYHLERVGKHGNNVVFKLVGLAEEPLIIQLSIKSAAAEDAYKTLREANPNWMARTADSVTYCTTQKETKYYYTASIIEYCAANLGEVVVKLQSEKDFSKRIDVAAQVARGISDILRFLTANKLIWTDLKPGNILLRKNNDQVIVDFKTIFNPELIPMKDEMRGAEVDGRFKMRKKGFENISFTETTDAYLSESFRVAGRTLLTTPIAARCGWEQEYSYQLAVLLHYVLATPDTPRLSPRFDTDILEHNHKTSFDFGDPVFASDEGQALKQIIELLSAHEAKQRVHHSELPGLLRLIKKPDAFAEKVAELSEKYDNNIMPITNYMEDCVKNLPKMIEAEKAFQAVQETSPRRRSSIRNSKKTRLDRSASKSPRDRKVNSPRSPRSPRNSRGRKSTQTLQRMTSSPDTMFHTPVPDVPKLPDAQTIKRRHKSAPGPASSLSPRGGNK